MSKRAYAQTYMQVSVLLALTYFVSYVTRINYGAVLIEMEKSTGVSSTFLSLAVSGSAVTYGFGQIISGICGDKFKAKKLIIYGLWLTAAMNLLIPLVAPNVYLMTAVWSVNGIAQAFMWPPIVVIMSETLTKSEYKRSTVLVSAGAQIGTISVYLFSPLLINIASWRVVFYVCALFAVLMSVVMILFCPDVKSGERAGVAENKKSVGFGGIMSPFLAFIMLAMALQGFLRDGITTWMPTCISETYNLGSSISILSGVVLPIFSITCSSLSLYLYNRYFKNPSSYSSLMFAIGTVFAVLLRVFVGKNAVMSIVSFGVLIGCMHGVNLMFTSMVPPLFNDKGGVAKASGIINSATYIGSAVSGTGTAVAAKAFGWTGITSIWASVALIGAVICFFLGKKRVDKI